MFKPQDVLISLFFFFLGIASISIGNAHVVYAAPLSPTATATRVLHVTVKAQSTPTPTATSISGFEMDSPNLSSSIEATVQAYMAQSDILTKSQTLTPTAGITVAQPLRLLIPTLKVDAHIEAVGRDRSGAMEIPSQVENVAWYKSGSAPGEIGNAVIAGHLDLADGSPAVFWAIGKLTIGDEVIVRDSEGVEYHFQVTGSRRYQVNSAPIEEIFGFSLKSQLNLITCAGTWDRKNRNYSNRLVVSAELIKTVRTLD